MTTVILRPSGSKIVTDAPGEVSFKRALVACAGEVWVAADRATVGAAGAFIVAPPEAIDVLATDADEQSIVELGLSVHAQVLRPTLRTLSDSPNSSPA